MDLGGRAVFKFEMPCFHGVRAQASGEKRASGKGGEDFGGSPAEGAVAGNVSCKGRRDESVALVGEPVSRSNPTYAPEFGFGVIGFSLPGADGDAVGSESLVTLAYGGGFHGDDFD